MADYDVLDIIPNGLVDDLHSSMGEAMGYDGSSDEANGWMAGIISALLPHIARELAAAGDENADLTAALLHACDDSFSDGASAARAYLSTAKGERLRSAPTGRTAEAPSMTDVGIFICPVCEAVIEGDRPCPNRNLRPHASRQQTRPPCPVCGRWKRVDHRCPGPPVAKAERPRLPAFYRKASG